MLNLPPSFFASSTTSPMVLAGNDGCASSATGIEAISPIGGEVLARIEARVGVEARVDRDRAGVAEEQRVAVGRAADHRARADQARAADAIVDDHLMAERAGQLFGDHARQHVDAAAGRIGHHQRDGAVRIIVLRAGRRRECRARRHAKARAPSPMPRGCASSSSRSFLIGTKIAPPALLRRAGGSISIVDLEVRTLQWRLALVSDAKALDLVLYLQLATLQFRNLEVVGRRMGHRIGDFVFERPVLPFKFRKMRLHGHMEWLLR